MHLGHPSHRGRSGDTEKKTRPKAAPAVTAEAEDAAVQPAGVRKHIESTLELARQNLTYPFGSSDPASGGRTYRGQKRNGVSVFDFHMSRTPAEDDQRSTFIGYARIPGPRD